MREGVLTFRARYVNIKNNVEIRGILSKIADINYYNCDSETLAIVYSALLCPPVDVFVFDEYSDKIRRTAPRDISKMHFKFIFRAENRGMIFV